MSIDFFQKEQKKVWDRFNKTFGDCPTIGPELRACTMNSIIYMGLIAKDLAKQKTRKELTKVTEFMKIKSAINKVFAKIENEKRQTQLRKENELCTTKQYAQNAVS